MPRKTRVLHITYDMHIGGTEQVIKNLIEGSDHERFEMSIFCLEEPLGAFGRMLLNQGIEIYSVQRKPGFDIRLIRAIRKYINSNNIHVLHCHQYTPWVYGTLAAIATGSRVIFTEHGRFYPDRSSQKRRFINPFLAWFTSHINAISKATRQALIEYEYLKPGEVEVVYNGLFPVKRDPNATDDLRNSLNISTGTIILGTIARFDPIKNHCMLLRAFSRAVKNNPDILLIMVGDGKEHQKLIKTVDNLNLRDKVVFTGYQSRPARYLELMDIFLLSSLSEGTSMTLLEAMSMSKPCIVTDAGGNREIIEHGVNGLVTENDNEDEFSAAISSLVINSSKRKDMAAQASIRFTQLFSASIMCDAYAHQYLNAA